MRFSDRSIKALKPRDKFYEVRDQNGFVLRVQPTGTKTFYYLFDINGKRRRVKIGDYGAPPLLTLADARKQHAHLVGVRKSGSDPSTARSAGTNTSVEQLCKEYIEYHAMKHKKKWKEDKNALSTHVLPSIGHRDAGTITRVDVITLLEKIHATGVERQVNVVHSILGKAFSVGLQRNFPGLEYNPCRDIPKIGKEKERNRVLSPDEIRTLWTAMDKTMMADSTKRCLKLILYTGQRPGECLHIERNEIDGAWWTIPSEKYKTDITHRVYLTVSAKNMVGKKGKPFPVPQEVAALSRATLRLCKIHKIDHFTPHDLRRTAATLMAENGVSDDHVDRVLGHKMGKIRRTYNRHTFDAEKQSALEILESALSNILSQNDD